MKLVDFIHFGASGSQLGEGGCQQVNNFIFPMADIL